VLGKSSQYIPGALFGIASSMAVLAAVAALGIAALLMMPTILAFSANLIIISGAFVAWGAALSVIGGLSQSTGPAVSSISSILTTFKLISDSMKGGVLQDVVSFASGLGRVSVGIASLVMGSQGLSSLLDSFTKLASMNLVSVFKPLIDLTEKQPEIDKLAKSLEKISRAMKPPAKTIWDTLGNLTGGNVSNPNADPFNNNDAAKKEDPSTRPSTMEKVLVEIRDRLDSWDTKIAAIAGAAGEASDTNINIGMNTGGSSGSRYSVYGPISALK